MDFSVDKVGTLVNLVYFRAMLGNPVSILFIAFLLYCGWELYKWRKARSKTEPKEVQKVVEEEVVEVEVLKPGVPYEMVGNDVFEIGV